MFEAGSVPWLHLQGTVLFRGPWGSLMERWPEPEVPPATILHVAITSWSTCLRRLAIVLPLQTLACVQDACPHVLPTRTHLYSNAEIHTKLLPWDLLVLTL